jgi:fucose permease
MLGPLLPDLSARWSLTDTQGGYLVTAQFLGSLISTVLSGLVLARVGFRWTMVLGACLMALGVATLISGSYLYAALSVCSYGFGNGLTVPTSNLLVARASGEERSVSLNLLNFFWGVGAVACPFLLALFNHSRGIALFLSVIVGFLGLLIVLLLLVPIGQSEAVPQPNEPDSSSARSAVIVVFGCMFFLYVGTESALGAWLATYAKRVLMASRSEWMTSPAYFYGALLVGRLAAPWSLKRIPDIAQARFAALTAAAGVAALLYCRTFAAIAVSAALVGLGLSTLYPIAIGLATAGLADAAARMMGTLFAFATLGGAFIPWTVGYVSTRLGNLRTALLIPLVGCLAIAALYWNPIVRRYQFASSSRL